MGLYFLFPVKDERIPVFGSFLLRHFSHMVALSFSNMVAYNYSNFWNNGIFRTWSFSVLSISSFSTQCVLGGFWDILFTNIYSYFDWVDLYGSHILRNYFYLVLCWAAPLTDIILICKNMAIGVLHIRNNHTIMHELLILLKILYNY